MECWDSKKCTAEISVWPDKGSVFGFMDLPMLNVHLIILSDQSLSEKMSFVLQSDNTIKNSTVSGSGWLIGSQLMRSGLHMWAIVQSTVNERADESNQAWQLKMRNAPFWFCNCRSWTYAESVNSLEQELCIWFCICAGLSTAVAMARTAWACWSAGRCYWGLLGVGLLCLP